MHDFVQLILNLLQRSVVLAIVAVVFCAIVLVVAFIIFRTRTGGSRRFPWFKTVVILAMVGYIAILLYVTLLRYGSGGWPYTNFHLFRAWREAWNGYSMQGWLNVLLNVAVFVPLGVLLPLLAKPFRKWFLTLPAGLGCSLIIELGQYFTCRGIFDVDDLFSNTLGCILGYCVVMFFIRLFSKQKRCRGRCILYFVCPIVCVVVLAGIFVSYQLKEYGNLKEAPAFAANVEVVEWYLACELDNSQQTAPIYQTETFDKNSCDVFGAEFADDVGITFPDTYYYDNSTTFVNHSTGDFLHVYYRDRSYEYTIGANTAGLHGTEVEEDTLRDLLEPYNISIPENAQFSYKGNGLHIFSVNMQADGDRVVDGTLSCRCRGGAILDKIENNLVTFTYYKDETIITQTQAYEQLCDGKFSNADGFEYFGAEQVRVDSCTLDYRIDTKGFYQPVYVFEVTIDNETSWEALIPAMK